VTLSRGSATNWFRYTCAPQKIRAGVFFTRDLADEYGFALPSALMASCGAMRIVPALLPVVSLLFSIVRDSIRFILLWTRSSVSLRAENLFLRKQLALYLERKTKPRRANDATRLTLALLSDLFAWKEALVIVKPETLISWHRKGLQLF